MTLNKEAQDFNMDTSADDLFADDFFVSDDEVDAEDDEEVEVEGSSDEEDEDLDEHVHLGDDEPEAGDLVVLEGFEDHPEEVVVFTVPNIPGAIDISEIPEDEEVIVDDAPEEVEADMWDWKSRGGHANFLNWLKDMIHGTPKHSGHDVNGLERAMSYVELLIKEISKAMRTDFRGMVDVNHCESITDGLYKSLDHMEDRLERLRKHKYPKHFKKKASWQESAGLVKEAKSVNITGISVTVPLLISGIARVLINGTVSAGHSMEDMYEDLKKEYDLTKREEFELQQLLTDMGYPIFRDRGLLNKQLDKTKNNNFDFPANYTA